MKDALNYDINKLQEKQCIAISKVLLDFFKENSDYYERKDYSDDILDSISDYVDTRKE